jgi:DNA-directed RNA polymerase specialized sigma24 family protein
MGSLMTNSDRYYIERCMDGHPDDYGHLVQRYKSMLVAVLTGKLGNRDMGEEAAQETYGDLHVGNVQDEGPSQ